MTPAYVTVSIILMVIILAVALLILSGANVDIWGIVRGFFNV